MPGAAARRWQGCPPASLHRRDDHTITLACCLRSPAPAAPPAVSAAVDAKLAQVEASAEARLGEAAQRLQARLEEGCHTVHCELQTKLGDASGGPFSCWA